MKLEMMECPQCGSPMPVKRRELGYHVCVNCSTESPKRGIPVMRGSGDHTWTETVIMEEDQYENYVVASAIEKGDKNAAKAEMLDMDKEDRNLQGPFRIINNTDKDRT